MQDVYHRLDLWDPIAAAAAGGGGVVGASAKAVYLDYFALQLAPRAYKEQILKSTLYRACV